MASMTGKPMLAQRTVSRSAAVCRRPTVAVRAAKRDQLNGAKAALFGLTVAALQAAPVRAEGGDPVDTAVASVTDIVKSAGAAVKSGLEVVGAGVNLLKQGYDVAAPVVKQGVDAVAPVVQEAYKATTEAAAPVVQKATPVVQETLQGAIKTAGVDVDAISRTTNTVVKTAADGATAATPIVNKVVTFLTTTEPVTLAEYGLGAVALYYLAPPLLGALFGGLRGFAGEISAAQALDTLSNESNAVLIDIRTETEKENSGLPDAPSSASGKILEVEYASIADRKLRGQLRDASGIEAQVTALQIASLKRLGRGTRIMLLDRYGSTAKVVARELARRGYGRVFVVGGGFDGRGGWVQSKLLVKPTAGMYSGDFGSKFARTISTRSATPAGRKALPAPSK